MGREKESDRVVRVIRSEFVGGDLFFCGFLCVPEDRSVGGFLSLGTGSEGFLGPAELFDLYGVDLLGSRGDWRPPWVRRLLSELWVKAGSPEVFVRFVRSEFVAVFFAGFGAFQRLGASDKFLSLGTDGEGFLEPTALFESSGKGLLGRLGSL